MPPSERPISKKQVEPAVVRRINPQGRIVEETQQLPATPKATRPNLKMVPAVETGELTTIPREDLIRVQKAVGKKQSESVYQINPKTGKPQEVLRDEVRQKPSLKLAPKPEAELPQIDVDFTELYQAEIGKARSWGELISALGKIGEIEEDDGTIYSAEYFIQIAETLQTQVAGEEYTENSPLFAEIPEKYGLRKKFLELLKETKPLTKAEIVFPGEPEAKPQPLKPLPKSQREVEPLPVFRKPEPLKPLPKAQQEVEPVPVFKRPDLVQQQALEPEPIELELVPAREPIEEVNYQSSAEYQDLSDSLNKRADGLLNELHGWNIEEHDRKATEAQIDASPYYKEFANTREQARLAAQLSDRQALYGMLKQEFSEIEDDMANDSAMDKKGIIVASARLAEIRHEMSHVYGEIMRLDNQFKALEIDSKIQAQKKLGFTPEEQKTFSDLARTYTELNRAQEALEQEKSKFLSGFFAFFSKQKKERVKAAEELVRSYSNRLASLSEEAVVARKAQKAREAKGLAKVKL